MLIIEPIRLLGIIVYFKQNFADYGGVLVASRQSTVTVEDTTFSRNEASTDGATLYARTQCTILVSKCTFNSNRVINDGILLASDDSNITVYGSTFNRNEAGDDGAVGYAFDSSVITVSACNLSIVIGQATPEDHYTHE